MVTRRVVLEFDAIFPEEDYKEYCGRISEIPQQFLNDFASTYLRYSINDERISNLKKLFGKWFRMENIKFAKEIHGRIEEIERKRGYKYLIINDITNLLLFEESLRSVKKRLEVSETELEILFFKIYLAYNQKSTENESLVGESTKELEFPYRINALLATQSIKHGDISHYNLKEAAICQTAKAITFFEFISSNGDFNSHLSLFNKHYSVRNHIEFLKEYLKLIIQLLRTKDEGKIDIVFPKGDEFERPLLFYNEIAITDPYSDLDIDFKLIRNFPLIKVEERKFRIISPLFTIEKFYNGLYFIFKEINASLPKEKRIKDIRSDLTYRFSEKHLLYELIGRCYNKKYIQKSGEEIAKSGLDGFVDYYIRNGNKVFLFESKDILINAEVKQSHDYKQIEAELKKKLYFEDKAGKRDLKAILQLIESIKVLLDCKFAIDNQYKPNSIRIYPIIVLHNRQLETLGINQILRFWWKNEMENLGKEGYVTDNINDVIILNVDTLILNSDNINAGIFKLEDVIDSYLNDTNQELLSKRKYRSIGQRKSVFQDSCITFSDYVMSRFKWKLPSMFEEKGLTLFQEEEK